MASYDNSRYTYQNVLKGNGYYQQDTALKYSEGVETITCWLYINFFVVLLKYTP